jgi:FKBP-type peptidyl-prolyl cis-trans isomerase SlyD
LEEALEGCLPGQKVSLDIPPSEIYGDHDPELIREIPKKGLVKQRVREGRFYRQMKKGSLISFKILEVRPETVLADFNRPMAGISVSLKVEVLQITDATKEEIDAAVEAQIRKGIGCE